jgi:hypothetical protein
MLSILIIRVSIMNNKCGTKEYSSNDMVIFIIVSVLKQRHYELNNVILII